MRVKPRELDIYSTQLLACECMDELELHGHEHS